MTETLATIIVVSIISYCGGLATGFLSAKRFSIWQHYRMKDIWRNTVDVATTNAASDPEIRYQDGRSDGWDSAIAEVSHMVLLLRNDLDS